MPATPIALAVVGTVLQTPTPAVLEVLTDVVIAVAPNGTIASVDSAGSAAATQGLDQARTITHLADHQRLLPGLIDLHVHAPQWPQLGTGLDIALEDWLFQRTFPLESRYANNGFATDVWNDMVPCLLAHGTTTAVYFSSIHEPATLSLAAACARFGQRAFVGRVAMDHPTNTPPWYRDADTATALAASARSVADIRELAGPSQLVRPILTPRFIPACTDELLMGMGRLAAETGALVQTHCSESDWEHHDVLSRFGRRDTDMLAHFGLARANSVLAHCNHMDDRDFDQVAALAAGIAHCPMSNSYFANAVFPTHRALSRGVHVGLGTDIAGGEHPGLLRQSASAVTASRMLEDGVDGTLATPERGVPESRIDIVTAFWMATTGGAEVLGLPLGYLTPGRSFDAMVVSLNEPGSPLRHFPAIDDDARTFEKIVRLADSTNISTVWVNGQVVSSRDR